jgi:hypothetical protein
VSSFEPIAHYPDNPHYFMFRGEPTFLFASGEHYSAVLNRAFDITKYLDTTAKGGFNHTRLFSGEKRERPGMFNISGNPQAPDWLDYVAPWSRTDVSGAQDGGTKFDLTTWNEEYFDRLRFFMREASERGIEVEFVLFSSHHIKFAGSGSWDVCPLNPANNVNKLPQIDGLDFHTLKQSEYVVHQDAMIRKLVKELNEFDNLHFEVCNEPTNDDIPVDWLKHVAKVIASTEQTLPAQHLISCTSFLGYEKIRPMRGVTIQNFHYASPESFADNYHLPIVLGMNETGILADRKYALQAWETLFSGAGLYNMLDYSFTVGHEDGTFELPDTQPGWGGVKLREELRVAGEFLRGMEFWRMRPDRTPIVQAHTLNGRSLMLAEHARQYALFVRSGWHSGAEGFVRWTLDIPAGRYRLKVLEAPSGAHVHEGTIEHEGGLLRQTFTNGKVADRNSEVAFAASLTKLE